MPRKFSLKEIAFQSGLSLATVDRALHGRAGVRAATQARVASAIAELERQSAEVRLAGRRLGIDIIMEAPRRFSSAVQAAFEAELPGVRPASLSARFHMAELMEPDELGATLAAVRRRGSHGVVLKAKNTPATAQLAKGLMQSGIPVVTLVTDLPVEARIAYVGIDNRVAGANAAYLLGRFSGARGRVLVSLSSADFAGEEDRAKGFAAVMAKHFPEPPFVTIAEGGGVHRSTYDLCMAALAADPEIRSVYSIGGGNRAILQAFADSARPCDAFVAHDLDATNRALLTEGRISFVIDHDLRQDARSAYQAILQYHRMLPLGFAVPKSRMVLLTPFDVAGV